MIDVEQCPVNYYACKGSCVPESTIRICDGINDCADGSDERGCSVVELAKDVSDTFMKSSNRSAVDPTLTIVVMPTILSCILLVFFMLLGIKKCKQWELDRLLEMRRSRRLMERMTNILREKNQRLIERAYNIRRQSIDNLKENPSVASVSSVPPRGPPPKYPSSSAGTGSVSSTGNSPPPSYEDLLMDNFLLERLHHRAASVRSKSTTDGDSGFAMVE